MEFLFFTSPTAIRGDGQGWVEAIQCVNMELGEPTKDGRRTVEPVAGSEHWLPAESVIVAIGQGPNPIIAKTTPGLATGLRGVVQVAPETLMTTREGSLRSWRCHHRWCYGNQGHGRRKESRSGH